MGDGQVNEQWEVDRGQVAKAPEAGQRPMARATRGNSFASQELRRPTCMSEAGAAILQGRNLLPRGTPATNLLVAGALQSAKRGKQLQERGAGVSLGRLRGSLGRSFGIPWRSPVGFWSVLGGFGVSPGGHWGGFGDPPWCLRALQEPAQGAFGGALGALWGVLGGSGGV